MINLKSD